MSCPVLMMWALHRCFDVDLKLFEEHEIWHLSSIHISMSLPVD